MIDDPDRQALDDLGSRLKKVRATVQDPLTAPASKDNEKGNALGLAFRVSVELVSGVAIGVGIGWLLDGWLGTRPWFMLAFIILGGAAGMLNVYRLASGFGYAAGYEKKNDEAGRDDGQDKGT